MFKNKCNYEQHSFAKMGMMIAILCGVFRYFRTHTQAPCKQFRYTATCRKLMQSTVVQMKCIDHHLNVRTAIGACLLLMRPCRHNKKITKYQRLAISLANLSSLLAFRILFKSHVCECVLVPQYCSIVELDHRYHYRSIQCPNTGCFCSYWFIKY